MNQELYIAYDNICFSSQIFAIEPNHSVWKRNRKEHHAGAIRPWLKDANDDGRLIGEAITEIVCCKICNQAI